MKLNKKDFIEIEFTGNIKDGEIFDSNIKTDLEKAQINAPAKPLIFCLGEGMFIKGVDEFLVGKDLGDHKIELSPEQAFGKRDAKLIQMIPMKVFHQQQINPIQGTMFNFDGRAAKILTVSGGRVLVDFNNPLAGKDLIYQVKVLRKINDLKEKITALSDFLFRREFKFEIKDKKLIMSVEKSFSKFVEMFKDKFKELFSLELEIKEIPDKVPKKE